MEVFFIKRILLLTVFISMLCTISFAARSIITIQVSKDVNAEINRQLLHSPFIYEGRVYVPFSEVANMLGKEVQWDPNSRTAFIYDMEIPRKPSLNN